MHQWISTYSWIGCKNCKIKYKPNLEDSECKEAITEILYDVHYTDKNTGKLIHIEKN